MKNFWCKRRVVVTGGCGFLGRHVVSLLQKKCSYVYPVSSYDYDLREKEHIRAVYQRHNPDTVIHLAAAVGGIGANKANPGKFAYDNLAMGIHLIEEARNFGVLKFVNIGSSCSYPHNLIPPFQEDHLWEGYPEETVAPYALAKKMLLVMSQGYRKQYGFNSIFLMPTNLYGPDDNFNLETSHVVPALIKKFSEAKDIVEVWGTGNATREFLHVDDCARAIIMATERFDGPEPVNIGTGVEVPIKTLVEMIRTYTKFKGTVTWNTSKPDGKPRCCLDTKRAYKEFGFKAIIPLEIGLAETVKWYRETYIV